MLSLTRVPEGIVTFVALLAFERVVENPSVA